MQDRSETSFPLTFQLFRSAFLKPKFTNILPPNTAPSFEYRLQLAQVLRFQEIFLGRS